MRYQILGVVLAGAIIVVACNRAEEQDTAAPSATVVTSQTSQTSVPAPTATFEPSPAPVVASTETAASVPPLVSPRDSEGTGSLVLKPPATNPLDLDAKLAARITAVDLKAKLDAGQAILIDVRDDAAWQLGHARGAMHIPMNQVTERAGSLPADKWIVAYCT